VRAKKGRKTQSEVKTATTRNWEKKTKETPQRQAGRVSKSWAQTRVSVEEKKKKQMRGEKRGKSDGTGGTLGGSLDCD